MAKLPPTLFAVALLSVGFAFAQEPAPTIAPTLAPPAAPAGPAPIEPPLQTPETVPQAVPPPAIVEPLPPGTVVSDPGIAPTASRLNEFQGDEIGLVLRTLARQAKMNIVVSDQVATTAGAVNMRIEEKSPKEAIAIIVTAKGLIMDEQNGVYFIKTTAEKAKEPTESGSFMLSYAQAKDILPLLQGQLASGVAPQFDQRTNTLFYRENRSNLDKIQGFLESIDRPTRQVMIEARLVEVTANPNQSYGINWAGVVGGASTPQTFRAGGGLPSALGSPQAGGFTNTQVGTAGGPPVLGDFLGRLQGGALSSAFGQFAILSAPQLSATVRLLNEDRDAEFLANPRVVTADNQKATIKITRLQPVPQLNFNEQTAQAVFSGFQDKEFGNTLEVTPSINKEDYVSMVVQPEISNKVADATFTFGGATVTSPVIDKRTLNSNVVIRSGDTLAIGGLLQDEQTKGRSKVPFLGDIPILGYAFQEKTAARTKRNLLVFVTPTIIKQGYGTGLEDQVSGLAHTGEEYADPNGWRNNAKGAKRLVPTSHRSIAADYAKPGVAPAPRKTSTVRVSRSRK